MSIVFSRRILYQVEAFIPSFSLEVSYNLWIILQSQTISFEGFTTWQRKVYSTMFSCRWFYHARKWIFAFSHAQARFIGKFSSECKKPMNEDLENLNLCETSLPWSLIKSFVKLDFFNLKALINAHTDDRSLHPYVERIHRHPHASRFLRPFVSTVYARTHERVFFHPIGEEKCVVETEGNCIRLLAQIAIRIYRVSAHGSFESRTL